MNQTKKQMMCGFKRGECSYNIVINGGDEEVSILEPHNGYDYCLMNLWVQNKTKMRWICVKYGAATEHRFCTCDSHYDLVRNFTKNQHMYVSPKFIGRQA